ncbi:MAG: M14 family zinc carboxypeptidase [Candidatus Thorarchaeota archaeon]|nr:M14 family zinc carboxypeptidase [Candidatus Thorarchaeota archaeon]
MAAQNENYVPVAEKVVFPSVTRTWDLLSLIYEDQFHDPAKLDEEIENILSLVPELVDIEIIGESFEGRNITSLRITNELNTVQKAKTLIVAQHHGREQITVELALRFILWLLNGYGTDTVLTEYVDTQEIYVIPTLNPDALEIVINEGNHWLRKNLRPYDNDGDGLFGEDDAEDTDGDGWISNFLVYEKAYPTEVPHIYDYDWEYWEGIDNDNDTLYNEDEVGLVDLNRNYPVLWDIGNTDVTTQEYRGSAPFSEPETQAFRDFAQQHKFAMAYSLHSGTNATFFVQDTSFDWVEPLLYYQIASDYRDILPSGFNQGIGYPASEYRQIESATAGGWGEWMYYEQGCTVPITFEVYTNESVNVEEAYVIIENNNTHMIREWEGIYGYFNPTPEYIQTLWLELAPAFEYFLEMTPRVDIEITGISGGVNTGDSVTLTASMQCLSPRLGSKESMKVLDNNSVVLDTAIAIGADQTLTDYPSFILSDDLGGSQYTILIGNNYTGYTQFQLTAGTTIGLDLVLIGISVGVVLVAVVVFVYMKKR